METVINREPEWGREGKVVEMQIQQEKNRKNARKEEEAILNVKWAALPVIPA